MESENVEVNRLGAGWGGVVVGSALGRGGGPKALR